jgi:hypothetical protein
MLHRENTGLRPGESGNPNGRPIGARNKLSQDFIDDFHQVWQEEGINALRNAARRSPARFIQVAASLIPQHFTLEHEHKLVGLSDDELHQRLIEAHKELAAAGITIDIEAEEVKALPAPEGNGSATSAGKFSPPKRGRQKRPMGRV